MISIVSLRRRSRCRFFLVGLWIMSLGAAFLAGAIVFRQRHQIRKLIGIAIRGRVIESNLYNIAVKTLPIPGEGRDGGIAALEDLERRGFDTFSSNAHASRARRAWAAVRELGAWR